MIHSTWARWLVRFTTYYLLHSTTFTTLNCFCFVSIKFFSKNDHLESLQLQGGGGGGGGGWGVDKVGREPGGQHRGDWLTYGPTRPAGQHRPAVRPSAVLCFIWEVLTSLHCNHWQYLPHRRTCCISSPPNCHKLCLSSGSQQICLIFCRSSPIFCVTVHFCEDAGVTCGNLPW